SCGSRALGLLSTTYLRGRSRLPPRCIMLASPAPRRYRPASAFGSGVSIRTRRPAAALPIACAHEARGAARAASLDPPGVRAVDRPWLPRRGRADRAARRALARERAAVEPAQDGGAARGEDARARVRRRVVRSGAESD